MKVLLTKASDWEFKKVIEINDIMELKNIDSEFVINFDFTRLWREEEKEKYKDCDFEAMIYDNYIE